ncbi:MAG TPA: hypothetical protein VI488_10885 [Candidatus Angelobacter sp.]
MTGLAAAQNQPSNAKPGLERREPLFFVKIAADVAGNVQQSPLNGFLGLYVSSENWGSGLKDSDLGPFMKVKEAKPGRSAACLFSDARDVAICVYFDGETPFGVAAVKAGASGKIEASDVAAAYKDLSKDMLKKGDQEFHFEPNDVATDDGQPIPGFLVTTGSRFPS